MHHFCKRPIFYTDDPSVRLFVSPSQKIIYYNIAADKTAKIIYILPPGVVLEM